MADGTITNFNGFLSLLDPTDKSYVLSVAYDPKATTENLRHAVYSVLDKNKYPHISQNAVNIDDVVNTAPKGEFYEIEQQPLDDQEYKKRSDYSHSGTTGTLINHEKYQGDILDAIAKNHEQQAIKELNDIRMSTSLSGLDKQEAIVNKFREILTRNATAEGSLQEQHELLAKHLEEAEIGKVIDRTDENGQIMLDKNGNALKTTDVAQKVRRRAGDIATIRQQEKNDLEGFQNLDIVKQQLKLEQTQAELSRLQLAGKNLTVEEQARRRKLLGEIKNLESNMRGKNFSKLDKDKLARFLQLRSKHSALDQTTIKNIDGLVKRFSRLGIEEQDALLSRILARQHRHTRGELWKVFDQEKRGKLTGLYKKTLTRKERRLLLNFQKKKIAQMKTNSQVQPLPRINRNFMTKLFGSDPRFSRQTGDFYNFFNNEYRMGSSNSSSDDQDTSSPDPMDIINKGKDLFDKAKDLSNLLNGGGASGGATAAGAAGTPIGVIILVVILVIVVIVIIFILLGKTPANPTLGQLEQEQCGDFAQQIDVMDTPDKFANIQSTIFHIIDKGGNYPENNAHFQDAITAYKEIFNTMCILYGHTADGITGNSYNTFAKLLLGDRLIQKNGTFEYIDGVHTISKAKAKFINQFVAFDDTQSNCYVSFEPNSSNDTSITTIFINPEKCTQDKLQYLVAQSLAHSIIIQQDVVTGRNNSVFNTFLTLAGGSLQSPVGVIGEDGLLPNPTCQTNPNAVYGSIAGKVVDSGNGASKIGENNDKQQQRNCFSDMVANYLTYGSYTQLAPDVLPSAPITPVASPSAKFTNFPDSYPDYFAFAKKYIFDGLVFFTTSSTSSCPSQDPSTTTQMIDVLQNTFNIYLQGEITQDSVVKDMYHTICKLSGYKFMQLLNVPKVRINIWLTGIHSCSGHSRNSGSPDATTWTINNFNDCGNNSWGNQFILTHELSHILQWEHPELESSFCTTTFHGIIKYGNICNTTAQTVTIPTYNCLYDYTFPTASANAAECFSDMAGEFLTYQNFIDRANGVPANAGLMSDFPKNFPSYYAFAQQNLFSSIQQQLPSSDNYSGTCKLGSSPCDPANLASVFGIQGYNASRICQAESSSNTIFKSTNEGGDIYNTCGKPVASGVCQEYSVGPFQINLNAHVQEFAPKCAQYIQTGNCTCKVPNPTAMENCLNQNGYNQFSYNEQYALKLLQGNGTHWQPIWSTAKTCAIP